MGAPGQSRFRLFPAPLYARERDSAIVPLPYLDLPRELRLLDLGWHRKSEFHVTAAHTPSIAERIAGPLGLGIEEALERAWAELAAASHEAGIGRVALGDEFWIVRREGDRTLIAMAEVAGLGKLYGRLAERLGIEVEAPPTHVTLYTAEPGGGGIGIHTREQLERDCAPLPTDEVGHLSSLLAAAAGRM